MSTHTSTRHSPTPRRKVPIAESAPAAPHCPGCGDALKPIYGEESREDSDTPYVRVFCGWNAYGAFCTMRCATAYANRIYKETGRRYRKAVR
jgi:hypothetical protein